MRIDLQNSILLLLCLVLLLFVFTLSASATGDLPVEVPVVSSSSDWLQGLYLGLWNNRDAYACHDLSYSASSENTIYVFKNSSDNKFVFVSSTANSVYVSNGSNHTYYNLNIVDSVTGLRYTSTPNSYSTANDSIPTFSFADGMSAVLYAINNPSESTTSFSYTLPPGNVAYIPIPRGQSDSITFTLTTTYYMAFGNNDISRINQVVTVMSALPSASNNVAPSSPKIPWTNNGNVNLLGVSASKIYQGSIPTNYGGQYLVIVNPMTMPSQTGLIGGDTYTNGSINISVSAVSGSPHIYPMTESLTITPGDGIGSESSYGDSGYTYEVDPETGEVIWTDPFGGSSAPVAGGNNPMPSPNTIFDWLRNISQQFSDFLRGPVQAVQVVVSAIRDFMGSFTQLYQWLPSPVYSLITSALMIALTIGVIKIFV